MQEVDSNFTLFCNVPLDMDQTALIAWYKDVS